ncbi:MAG: flagellar hook-basal body complex protein [Pontibacterium sp.]
MAGFNTAVTGIKAAQTDLDVTGNNIANASTVGFKASRTEFGDIYTTAVVGAGTSNVAGSGVTVSDIAQDFQAGTIEFTNSNLDLAIDGSGFFQLDDGQGGVTYTRAGSFELDKDGYVVSKTGKYLQGYGLDEQGNQLPITNLAVTQKESAPHATENIGLSFNIDAALESADLATVYDKTNANSFSYTTTVETFDSLGNAQAIKFNYAEQRPVRETYDFTLDDSGATIPVTVAGIAITDIEATSAVTGDHNWDSTTKLVTLDSDIAADIEAADPRIDTDSFRWDDTTATLTFEFKSEFSQYGELPDVSQSGTDLTPTNLSDSNNPETRTANEVQTFIIDENDNTKFDATTGYLINDVSLVIGGVTITLDAADNLTADEVGETITASSQRIIDQNPDIQGVQYNASSNTVYITWTAESGDVDPIATENEDDVFLTSNAGSDPAAQEGDNSWMSVYRVYAYLNDTEQLAMDRTSDVANGETPEPGPIIIKFDTRTGVLNSIDGEEILNGGAVPSITILGADPANPNDDILESDTDNLKGIQMDIEGASQFASDSIVKSSTQDGYTKGDLVGVTFAETGEMVASFSNGQRQNLGLVAVATFENQAGLQPAGDTEWAATLTSGQAILNPPGAGLNGSLQSAALEQSNVDLSEELVNLIESQRNYQANSKTLETLNTVTQAILQI